MSADDAQTATWLGDFDPHIAPELDRSALLVIDTQVDFVDGGSCAVNGTTQVVPLVARLLVAYRMARRPIVHVVRLYDVADLTAGCHRPHIWSHTNAVRELRALPKAHLHLHLTGSARLGTIREFADQYGISLPPALVNEEYDWGQRGRDWSHFQGRYDAARQTIRSADDVRRIIREAAEDDAAEGSGWLELQVDSSSYAHHLGGVDSAVEIMLDACQDAARATGIGVGLLLAVSWGVAPEQADRVARIAARHAHRGVVGFGISNDERLGEPDDFISASRIAREAGLVVAPHAGFYAGHLHVRRCVEHLGARRIGHGITAALSPPTLEMLACNQVTMEICPTSYLPLGVLSSLAQVPVTTFQRAGVAVALGADDPLIFGTRLAGQYEILRDVHGLDDQALADLARDSVRACAAPSAVKERLVAGIDGWLD